MLFISQHNLQTLILATLQIWPRRYPFSRRLLAKSAAGVAGIAGGIDVQLLGLYGSLRCRNQIFADFRD
jgi:hypothetical protein